jgi:hypothetical protein
MLLVFLRELLACLQGVHVLYLPVGFAGPAAHSEHGHWCLVHEWQEERPYFSSMHSRLHSGEHCRSAKWVAILLPVGSTTFTTYWSLRITIGIASEVRWEYVQTSQNDVCRAYSGTAGLACRTILHVSQSDRDFKSDVVAISSSIACSPTQGNLTVNF